MKKNKNVAIMGGLSDEKFVSKIQPLIDSDYIKKIYLFRYSGNPLIENNKIKSLPFVNNLNYPRIIFDFFLCFYLFYLCIFKKIDFLLGIYFFPYGIYAGIFGKIFNIPVIQLLTGTDLKLIIKYLFLRTILNSSSYIGVRGDNSLKVLIDIGISSRKIFIQHNLFNLNNYINYNGVKKKSYDLIFIGYIRRLKRLDILLETVAILKKDFPELNCLIVGDGPELAELKRLKDNLGIEGNVIFYGYSDKVKELLYQSKIFILTSESEGLPMVIIEAMACGLPVVVPGINDIPSIVVNESNGFLIHGLEPDKFASSCRLLLQDDKLRVQMGNDALKSVIELHGKYYSEEAINKVWSNILSHI